MTCSECVNLLLESGRDEIVRADSSELGRHLMTCPRCRQVADGILGQTVRIAGVFGAERSKRKAKRVAATTIGVATMLLVVGFGFERGAHKHSPSRPVVESAVGRPAVNAPVSSPVHETKLGSAAIAHPIVANPLPAAQPLLASTPLSTEVAAADAAALEPEVAVTPPPGINAAVLRTNNPKMTVVWLYQSSGDHP